MHASIGFSCLETTISKKFRKERTKHACMMDASWIYVYVV
jgi:hypothetical protein